MQKYNIEGNINFYDELFKSLDADSDDESSLCQISGVPLEPNSVTLECNHKFNYEPLYKEICRQKYHFFTYEMSAQNKKDQIKIKESKLDYFIKCPYCRNIQFTILPFYPELGLKPKYGINSLDPIFQIIKNNKQNSKCYGADNHTFYLYGKLFKKGICCFETATYLCTYMYVTPIENTDKTFCIYHYKNGLKQIKNEEKQKKIEEKLKEKEEKLKEKEEKQKLLDEKNAERLEKGLMPLKRLPIVKKKIQNVVQQIGQYVPEGEETSIEPEIIECKSILKSGPNKGLKCGCKKIYADGLCKRHSVKNKEDENSKE